MASWRVRHSFMTAVAPGRGVRVSSQFQPLRSANRMDADRGIACCAVALSAGYPLRSMATQSAMASAPPGSGEPQPDIAMTSPKTPAPALARIVTTAPRMTNGIRTYPAATVPSSQELAILKNCHAAVRPTLMPMSERDALGHPVAHSGDAWRCGVWQVVGQARDGSPECPGISAGARRRLGRAACWVEHEQRLAAGFSPWAWS
jgi:hypothetical protein